MVMAAGFVVATVGSLLILFGPKTKLLWSGADVDENFKIVNAASTSYSSNGLHKLKMSVERKLSNGSRKSSAHSVTLGTKVSRSKRTVNKPEGPHSARPKVKPLSTTTPTAMPEKATPNNRTEEEMKKDAEKWESAQSNAPYRSAMSREGSAMSDLDAFPTHGNEIRGGSNERHEKYKINADDIQEDNCYDDESAASEQEVVKVKRESIMKRVSLSVNKVFTLVASSSISNSSSKTLPRPSAEMQSTKLSTAQEAQTKDVHAKAQDNNEWSSEAFGTSDKLFRPINRLSSENLVGNEAYAPTVADVSIKGNITTMSATDISNSLY